MRGKRPRESRSVLAEVLGSSADAGVGLGADWMLCEPICTKRVPRTPLTVVKRQTAISPIGNHATNPCRAESGPVSSSSLGRVGNGL
jgi:hypothetical protein